MPATIGLSEASRSRVRRPSAHRVFVAERLMLVALLAFILAAFASTSPMFDFVEYWASAHALVSGQNPYSIPGIMRAERAVGWPAPDPLMNLNPPWALPLVAPIGFWHSYRITWFAWATVLSLAIFVSTAALLRFYCPECPVFPNESFLSQGLLAVTLVPAIFAVKLAQTNSFVLLGLVGFLWCERQRRDALAGICLALAAAKPQLVYLLWLALLFDCWRGHRWKMIASLGAAIAMLTAVAAVMRPGIWADYIEFSRSGYMSIWPSAIGGILRFAAGDANYNHGHFSLQFVAPMFGAIWFLLYWLRRRDCEWNWGEEIPMLVAVSLLTSAYGWMPDGVVLLVPIATIAAREVRVRGSISRDSMTLYAFMNLAIVVALAVTLRMSFVATNLIYPIAPVAVLFALLRASRYSSVSEAEVAASV